MTDNDRARDRLAEALLNGVDPFAAAAYRQRRAVMPPGGRQEGALTQFVKDVVTPQTPIDVGLMFATGPFRPVVKTAALAVGAALQPDEAQAGIGSQATRIGRGLADRVASVLQNPFASKSARLYNPPDKPQIPIEVPYPRGVPVDATGRITHDPEGRQLVARYVAGRRMVAGRDEPLAPTEVVAAATQTLGRHPEAVAASQIGGDAGRFVATTDRRSGRVRHDILWNRGLAPAQAEKVVAHETGHLISAKVGEIPTEGLHDELRQLYNTLNTGQERTRHLTGPQHLGYSGADVPKEYMAEAIRAYLANPNYIKTVAQKPRPESANG
jgi:hypothetical protein